MANFHENDPRDPSQAHEEEDTWVSEDEVRALADEREILNYDEVEQAERILKENLPAVTHSIIKLARSASSETVRLNAAKYVMDRNLGKITEPQTDEDDVLKELYEDVTVRNS